MAQQTQRRDLDLTKYVSEVEACFAALEWFDMLADRSNAALAKAGSSCDWPQ